MRACKRGLVALVVLALLGIGVGCGESSSPSEPGDDGVLVGFFGVDPAAAFLHTCGDPGAVDTEPIILADQGLVPGTSIRIEVLGQFFGGGGNSDGLEAVFSSSGTLLDGSELNRVPDAIDAGEDYDSPPTFGCGGEPTDIPEDFVCTPEVSVTIPVGATHLFLSATDVYFGDNTDTDEDFGVNIWKQE
jgi:hypothetical protein